jgi:hypothetical protein
MATSFNRLVAVLPHSVGHVEAPGPDYHHAALDDRGKDHDPSDDVNAIALKPPSEVRLSNAWVAIISPSALAPCPQPRPAPTGRALPPCRWRAEKEFDNNPRLKDSGLDGFRLWRRPRRGDFGLTFKGCLRAVPVRRL